MSGTSHNCRPNRRCRICGKPDYCNWVSYPNGDILEYCHRVVTNVGDQTVGTDGQLYVLKRITEQGFAVWEPSEQHERNKKEYIEKLKAEGKPVRRSEKRKAGQVVESAASLPKEVTKAENSAEKAAPERIDEVLRTFLSLLVLEDKHRDILKLEWDDEMLGFCIRKWNIKSVPPEDRIRFSSREPLRNKSRKKIMEELVSRVGEPKGVPGFYRRKDGVWTFCYLCGIAYPVMNTYGQMVGIEIGNDYPLVENIGDDGEKISAYRYMYSDGKAGWYEIPRKGDVYDYSGKSLVWEYGSDNNKISLNKKNLPKGKVSGKYKPFFSERIDEKIREKEGRIVNIYDQGCSGGSPASLYAKEGDDWSFVYITEGAKKGISANYRMNVPVLVLTGVGKFGVLFSKEDGYPTTPIDGCKKMGAKGFIVAYDADKNTNVLVLKSEENLIKQALSEGLIVGVAEWNAAWGKGFDDILNSGVMPQVTLVS